MTEPIFSIITVTKNNAAGLRLTAKSIAVQQGDPSFEWIIIDGASTDNTNDIIQEYLTDNTKYVSEPDDGIYDAMNKGINLAGGRYLWFLNAGDYLADAYTLRDTANEIKYNMAPDFIYGNSRENGVIKHAHDANRFAWGMFGHHQAMLYRRPIVNDLRYDNNYKISGDYAFTLHILARAKRVHHFSRVICDFAGGGISQTNAIAGRQENYEIRRDLLLMNPIKNKIIFCLNGFTFWARQSMPSFYRLARIFSQK